MADFFTSFVNNRIQGTPGQQTAANGGVRNPFVQPNLTAGNLPNLGAPSFEQLTQFQPNFQSAFASDIIGPTANLNSIDSLSQAWLGTQPAQTGTVLPGGQVPVDPQLLSSATSFLSGQELIDLYRARETDANGNPVTNVPTNRGKVQHLERQKAKLIDSINKGGMTSANVQKLNNINNLIGVLSSTTDDAGVDAQLAPQAAGFAHEMMFSETMDSINSDFFEEDESSKLAREEAEKATEKANRAIAGLDEAE